MKVAGTPRHFFCIAHKKKSPGIAGTFRILTVLVLRSAQGR